MPPEPLLPLRRRVTDYTWVAVASRLWRLIATVVCYTVFGLGGLLLHVFIFPLMKMVIWQRPRQMFYAKSVVHQACRLFIGLMRMLGVLQYEVIGQERLHGEGLLILANHPTLIDTVFLMAFVKNADCIVKADLKTNPFTRGAVNAAGYIFNNQGSELIDDCVKSLQGGNNVIVFPEGTRTAPDGQIRLKRGAATIAVRAKCNVTPVLMTCWPPTLGKGDKWWKIPRVKVTFRIEVQEELMIAPFIHEAKSDTLAARHLTAYLQTYFIEGIRHYA